MQYVGKLLEKDPLKRLGCDSSGLTNVKTHEWLHNECFLEYVNYTVQPKYIPHIAFEAAYTKIVSHKM